MQVGQVLEVGAGPVQVDDQEQGAQAESAAEDQGQGREGARSTSAAGWTLNGRRITGVPISVNKRGNSLSDRPHQAYLGQINSNSISECLEKLIDWLILIFKGI